MYYLLVFLILILYYRCAKLSNSNREKTDKWSTIFICIILVLMAAFRSDEVGADTFAYRYDYENLAKYTFADLIDRYSIYYIGYYGLSKIFHLVGLPVQIWFGFIEVFYLFALMKLVNRFSNDKIFSILVYTTIGLYTFSMAGLKQTLAASIMMLSFLLFIDKKYVLSILLVVVTYYTHQAALVFLIAYPAYLFRNSKFIISFAFISCVLLFLYGTLFIETMLNTLNNEHFQAYNVNESTYSYATFIFYATITTVCLLAFKNYKKQCSDNSRFFLSMSILGCGLQLLGGISPSLFRLALMFTPFMMILLPNIVYYSSVNTKKTLMFVLMISIIFYFLYTNRDTPYSFI